MQLGVEDLTISNSSFSESALSLNIQTGGAQLRRLAIHDPNFRGDIPGWATRSLEHLDLSHSGITSASFVGRALDVQSLDLSHTKVDNRIFNFLRNSYGMHVNLSHTQVTALPADPGNAFYSYGRPYQVALGQFTDREILNLRRSRTIRFAPKSQDQMPWFRY